jgi:hypothetical protein
MPAARRASHGRPCEWEPLVSTRQWAILAHTLRDAPEILGDLRVVLAQLSPAVRCALLAHLMQSLASGMSPASAVWRSLVITGHEVKLRSAAALGRRDALADQAPSATVITLAAVE